MTVLLKRRLYVTDDIRAGIPHFVVKKTLLSHLVMPHIFKQ